MVKPICLAFLDGFQGVFQLSFGNKYIGE